MENASAAQASSSTPKINAHHAHHPHVPPVEPHRFASRASPVTFSNKAAAFPTAAKDTTEVASNALAAPRAVVSAAVRVNARRATPESASTKENATRPAPSVPSTNNPQASASHATPHARPASYTPADAPVAMESQRLLMATVSMSVRLERSKAMEFVYRAISHVPRVWVTPEYVRHVRRASTCTIQHVMTTAPSLIRQESVWLHVQQDTISRQMQCARNVRRPVNSAHHPHNAQYVPVISIVT